MPELPRGYGQAGDLNVDKGRAVKGPRIFWLPPGGETTITILDEPPVRVVRHKLFLRRDNVAARMRQTCWGWNPDANKDPCPRECLVCNASLKFPRKIGRDGLAYVTIIDEREFTYNNRQYKDMKMLLELDAKGFDSFSHLARTYGQMKFRRFKVYRSQAPKGKPQTSAKHGDHWTDLGVVNPTEHFWYSPAIQGMMESAQRRGEQAKDHAATVAELISPIDYGQEIGTYKPEEASQFVGYLEGQLGSQGGGGWQAAPPIPGAPGTGIPGGFAPAPGAVMPGQAPAYAPPAPQAAPPQPPAAPPAAPVPPPFPGTSAPPQPPAYPAAPTHVGPPAPAYAPPPPQAPAAPPMPQAPGTPPAPPPWATTPPPPPGVQPPAGAQAPPPPPAQYAAPQPPTFGGTPLESVPRAANPAQAPAPPPQAPPQAPPAAPPAPPAQAGPPPVGGGYDFQQGWNAAPPAGGKDEPF